MSKIKMSTAFLLCFTAVGFSQNKSNAQSQAPAARPQTVHVSAAVMAGLVDHKALPQYPEEALTKGIQGDAVFKIVVDESGNIVRSEPMAGDPLLVATSANAIRDYRFRPYLLNGSPVRVESQLGFHFTLTRQGDSTEGQVECMSTIP
jgi:outer membrane biosynthesis protein TonB